MSTLDTALYPRVLIILYQEGKIAPTIWSLVWHVSASVSVDDPGISRTPTAMVVQGCKCLVGFLERCDLLHSFA